MFDKKFFDDVTKRFMDSVPESVKNMGSEVEKQFRSVLQTTFAKLDLITREEFDVQQMVLSKTRAKVEKLEELLHELEKTLENKKKK